MNKELNVGDIIVHERIKVLFYVKERTLTKYEEPAFRVVFLSEMLDYKLGHIATYTEVFLNASFTRIKQDED